MKLRPYVNLAKNIVVSNFTRLDFPYKLTFSVTYWCNYACKTCNIWQRKPVNELKLKEIQTFFKKNNQFSWIHLTGGEVFLRKDFVDIAEAIISECKNLILLNFPTNGYLTDKIVAGVNKIMSMKPERLFVTISTDGDEKLNDEIRGIQGGWRRQIETFKQLYHIPGVKVVLGMTLSQYNLTEFPRAFEAAKKECDWLDYEDFHVNIAHVSEHYYGNGDMDLKSIDVETVISEVKKFNKLRGIPWHPISILEKEYLRLVEKYLREGKTPMRCHALKSSCFLNSFGDVYPCSMYDKVIGNIRNYDYDLSPIWNSEKCVKVQKEIWEYKCPQCWTPCEAYQSILGNVVGRN